MSPQTDNALPFDATESTEKSALVSQQHVFNVRKYLLVLLFIQWFISNIVLAVDFYVVSTDPSADVSNALKSLIPLLVLSIYYTFGLLVAQKLNRIGLLLFGIIGVILFIILYIFVGYILLSLVAIAVEYGDNSLLNQLIVGFGIVLALITIVMILTLKFAFNLAKLIANIEYTIV